MNSISMGVETGDKLRTSLEGKLPKVRKAQNQKCRKTNIQFRRKKRLGDTRPVNLPKTWRPNSSEVTHKM
jgi:hypothetical protein